MISQQTCGSCGQELPEKPKTHIFLTREQLLNKTGSRMCVCSSGWDWNGKPEPETNFHCNNKTCVYWNMITNEHSTARSRLDILYELVYQKGFCKCKKPKFHEPIPDYELCVNDDCFAVLKEYKEIVIDQSLYPRG